MRPSTAGRRLAAMQLATLAICLLLNYSVRCMAIPIVHHPFSTSLAQERRRWNNCLTLEPTVRIEKAPQNSIRIFAAIDIPADVDEVWDLLTDYENLQTVIPNLVANEVLARFAGRKCCEMWQNRMRGGGFASASSTSPSNADMCKTIANQMRGSVLKQVGGAKVMGIKVKARTTLEVREWPMGMPDFAHYEHDDVYGGKGKGRKLKRYIFPKPFTVPSLPRKDISMQSIEKDDGEFRMYQGVWRMQPLPGSGRKTRLTYAVEVSPRVPVALVEERIAQDLSINLEAIRDVCTKKKQIMRC